MARRLGGPSRATVARGVLAGGVLAGAMLLTATTPASASCATDDLSRLAPSADVALVGTVTSVAGGTAELRVSDVWRGSPGAVVEVDGGEPSVSTAVGWERSRQYAVLAQQTAVGLTTDLCAGTRPVDDAAIAALDSALGPATPLGRGAGTTTGDPAATASPTPTEGAADGEPDGTSTEPAAAGSDDSGLSTSELVAGILLGLALLATFLLPQLRRHNRERRRERRDGVDSVDEPPEPDDPAESWR